MAEPPKPEFVQMSGLTYWESHPKYPVEDWQAEVAAGDTRQGYHEWVASLFDEDDLMELDSLLFEKGLIPE